MQYDLELQLNQGVDADTAKFELQSVGRMGVTLQKREQQTKWHSLVADGSKKPANMGVWWDQLEKYESELDKIDKNEIKDEGVEQEATKKKKVKKSSKKKAKAQDAASAQNPDVDTMPVDNQPTDMHDEL